MRIASATATTKLVVTTPRRGGEVSAGGASGEVVPAGVIGIGIGMGMGMGMGAPGAAGWHP